MTPLFKKLNFKNQNEIIVLNHPEEFQHELDAMRPFIPILTTINHASSIDFILSFVTEKQQIDELISEIAPILNADALLWFAYPKGTSKKYSCNFNRDSGWEALGKHGFEPVRMVAIDADWSAIRFRHLNFIKELKRNPNMRLTK
jgi:hypothetical protein